MNAFETISTGRADAAQRLTAVVFYLVLTVTWTSYLVVLLLRSSRSASRPACRRPARGLAWARGLCFAAIAFVLRPACLLSTTVA